MTSSSDDVILRTLHRQEYFTKEWAEARYAKAVHSKLRDNEDGAELAANFTGDLVAYFQYLVERDFQVAWAESDYELIPVEDSEVFFTDKSGTLKSAVLYRFTITIPENYIVRKDNQ